MFDDAARKFLGKPLIARLTTMSSDGYPHSVPIWYMLDGDDLLFVSDRVARKVQNVLGNSKGSAVVGGDVTDEAGYMFRGDLSIEEDPDHVATFRMVDRYETKENGDRLKEEWKNDDVVVIRLRPKTVIKVR